MRERKKLKLLFAFMLAAYKVSRACVVELPVLSCDCSVEFYVIYFRKIT